MVKLLLVLVSGRCNRHRWEARRRARNWLLDCRARARPRRSRPGAPAGRSALVGHGRGHVELALGNHLLDHSGLDRSRADRVDADPAGRVFERRALGQAEDAGLGGVVDGAARESHQAAQRGAVDDGAAALRAHRPKLVLHAGPDAAQVDRVHAVEDLGRFVGGSVGGAWMPALLNAKSSRPKSVTVRSTSPATFSSSQTSQTTPSGLVALGGQLRRRPLEGLLVAVGESMAAPDRATARAVASPVPEPVPVTTATRSRKS